MTMKMRDLASRLGMIPVDETRRTAPYDPRLLAKAIRAHEPENRLICVRLLKREIELDEAKRQTHEVAEKLMVTYLALIKEEEGKRI
jgi:hypothetical protein